MADFEWDVVNVAPPILKGPATEVITLFTPGLAVGPKMVGTIFAIDGGLRQISLHDSTGAEVDSVQRKPGGQVGYVITAAATSSNTANTSTASLEDLLYDCAVAEFGEGSFLQFVVAGNMAGAPEITGGTVLQLQRANPTTGPGALGGRYSSKIFKTGSGTYILPFKVIA